MGRSEVLSGLGRGDCASHYYLGRELSIRLHGREAAEHTAILGRMRVRPWRVKIVIWLLPACLFTNDLAGQGSSTILHRFQLWGTLHTHLEKLIFLEGWTNGFFHGPRSAAFGSLADCIESNMSEDQTIAMVDKFYKDHPERWSVPIGNGLVLALTVKDGPCAGKDPWR